MSGRLVLVRHGQSYGNVERRLDTRPPGTALTPLGRDQALAFAKASGRPAILAHSVAVRASETAAVIGAECDVVPHEVAGIHEVQVGDLENRNDDEAVAEFNAVYERWQHGELDVGARHLFHVVVHLLHCFEHGIADDDQADGLPVERPRLSRCNRQDARQQG